MDLGAFLRDLEQGIAAEAAGVDDTDLLRRTMPHWLHHIVEGWVTDRLATWRISVLADARTSGVDDEAVAVAELLVPSLHPAPLRSEADWTRRIGLSAALGGGAAMLAFGLWLPGLLALGSGLAWSSIARGGRDADVRAALVESARAAVRHMGEDAQRMLRDQLEQMARELETLTSDRFEDFRKAREELRGRLDDRRAYHTARLEELRGSRDRLESAAAELFE